jgi:hypothetical protein
MNQTTAHVHSSDMRMFVAGELPAKRECVLVVDNSLAIGVATASLDHSLHFS